MKKTLFLLMALLLSCALTACKGSSGGSSPPRPDLAEETAEPEYIYTITVDDTFIQKYLGATATFVMKASLSHIGTDPYGEYRGEYNLTFNVDMGVIGEISGAAYDLDGWFGNDSFTFVLDPYKVKDHSAYDREQRATDGPMLAPLVPYTAMSLGGAMPYNQGDTSMFVAFDSGGLADLQLSGNLEQGVEGGIDSIVGSWSGSDIGGMPAYSVLVNKNQSVIIDLYSPNAPEQIRWFKGTIDAIPLKDTIQVGGNGP